MDLSSFSNLGEHLGHLAGKPAGEDQIARARTLVGDSVELKQRLDSFLGTGPTRGQMLDFLETLHDELGEQRVAKENVQLRVRLDAICEAAGIVQPTGADRLMAMQIGLLQEQNSILRKGFARSLDKMRADADAASDDAMFTSILGSVLLGAVLTR